MDRLFFDLQPTEDRLRWRLNATQDVCVGDPHSFMFGGVGLGGAVAALEAACQRQLLWATAQFLDSAKPGEVVDLDLRLPIEGRYNTQAQVTGRVGEREIMTVLAALGTRPNPISEQWPQMPEVARPTDCEIVPPVSTSSIRQRLELRLARGQYGLDRVVPRDPEARLCLWVRSVDGLAMTPSLLAVIGDQTPAAAGGALGRQIGGYSLDNSLRIRQVRATEWALCEIRMQWMQDGFGHGVMNIFSEDGWLMATASQTFILRMKDEEGGRGG